MNISGAKQVRQDTSEAFRNIGRTVCGLAALAVLGLSACTGGPAPIADSAAPPAETLPAPPTRVPSPSPEPSPTPIREPAVQPLPNREDLPIHPPRFDPQAPPETYPFSRTDAQAVYAYYRQEVGPQSWADDAAFIQAMSAYYESELVPAGILLQQARNADQQYALLTRRQDSEMLLDFDTDSQALNNFTPGQWSPDSTPTWVDVGDPVKLFVGPDNLAYIGRLDPQTKEVTSFFNPLGATLSNLEQHWIKVVAGQATARWDEPTQEWTSQPPPCDLYFEIEKEYETYFGITNKEIRDLPTTLSLADLKDPSLGLMLQGEHNQLGTFQILSGKIAKAYPISLQLGGVDVPGLAIVLDMPTSDGKNWVRLTSFLDQDYFKMGSVLPLKPHLEAFTQLKLNPPSSTIDNKLLWDTARSLGYEDSDLSFSHKDDLALFNTIYKNPEKLVGAPFAFKQPPAFNRDLRVDIPYPVAQFLAGLATKAEVLKYNQDYRLVSVASQAFLDFSLLNLP